MKRVLLSLAVGLLVCGTEIARSADKQAARSSKEALQAFQDLIGPWKATGEPQVGTPQERKRNFWIEKMSWEWQFKGDDAWLKVAFEEGKYFAKGELRYLPDKDHYQLTLHTLDKEAFSFTGALKKDQMILERSDDKKNETQRLVFTFLHANRFLYRYEVKAKDKADFAPLYKVGVTKTDVPFAGPGDNRPECVVSGGKGTIAVSHKGKTYYVCCSGCAAEFRDDPEKYIKEYEEKLKKGKK